MGDSVSASSDNNDVLLVPEKKSVTCKYCNKVILTKILKEHEKICQFRSQERVILYAEDVEETTAETMDTALPPQPPLNVQVVRTTCETIALSWTTPIFDGGAAIEGYEIRGKYVTKRVGKKIREHMRHRFGDVNMVFSKSYHASWLYNTELRG